MTVRAIILDGFHKGHSVVMRYSPRVKLLKPTVIRQDYCCDNSQYQESGPEAIEYKECNRAIDQKTVLYSQAGDSEVLFSMFDHEFSKHPWTKKTVLKFGYHDEPVERSGE